MHPLFFMASVLCIKLFLSRTLLARRDFLMCTAATYLTKDFYFGRTFDNDFSYGESVVVLPKNYPLHFRQAGSVFSHYAMIGTAHIIEETPLYYDAANEKGLAMAGLNFVGNACYHPPIPTKDNITHFEVITWILGQCATVREARTLLSRLNITPFPFHDKAPVAQLHWLIADKSEAIVVESVQDGVKVYDDPAGVLTNNPTFPEQMFHLNNFMSLSPKPPQNHFSKHLNLNTYSLGMGAIGLPGDLSSQSRFVRAAFTRLNSTSGDSETESVSQFFHILNAVNQPRGCNELESGKCEVTFYTSCCNTSRGIYYYTTYENRQISAVDLHHCDLSGTTPLTFPFLSTQHILYQN